MKKSMVLFILVFSALLVQISNLSTEMWPSFCFAGEICHGDFDLDCDIDGSDLAVFAANFNRTDCEGDFNGDGIVDVEDLGFMTDDFVRPDCPRIELKYIDSADLELTGALRLYNEFARSLYYRPKSAVLDGFYPLAHNGITETPFSVYDMPELRKYQLVARDIAPNAAEPALMPPESYTLISQAVDMASGLTFRCWRPVPPAGYVSLGDIYTPVEVNPTTTGIQCVHKNLVHPGKLGRVIHLNPAGLNTFRIDAHNIDMNYNKSMDGISVNGFKGSLGSTFPDPEALWVLNKKWVLNKEYLTPQEVENLIDTHGPVFRFHSEEIFFPDYPAATIDDPQTKLAWCVIDPTAETDYDWFTFFQWPVRYDVTAATILQIFEAYIKQNAHYINATPGFRYYLELPAVAPGNINRAKGLVHVRLRDHLFTELQFWLWYPFNGPGRARGEGICNFSRQLNEYGRHYGDWENVTLTFLTETKELQYVEMSRHFTSQLFARHSGWNGLEFNGESPVVYVAKYSHAHYPLPGYAEYMHEYKSIMNVYPFDLTDSNGRVLGSNNEYEVIASHYPGFQVEEPDWIKIDSMWGRWGQYIRNIDTFCFDHPQKEMGNGPTGPTMKAIW